MQAKSSEPSWRVSFREITESDWDAVVDILNVHINRGDCTLWQKPFSRSKMQQMYHGLSDREGIYIVEKEGTIIGYGVIIKYHPKEGYRFTCETSVFLHPSEVGKGYGTAFKSFILGECKAKGYRHVVAKIFASNTRSIQYNKKLGYELVGIQKDVGLVNNKFIDIAIMQYLIN